MKAVFSVFYWRGPVYPGIRAKVSDKTPGRTLGHSDDWSVYWRTVERFAENGIHNSAMRSFVPAGFAIAHHFRLGSSKRLSGAELAGTDEAFCSAALIERQGGRL